MKISRRNFLAAAPLTAGAILSISGFGEARPAFQQDLLAGLSWDSFYPYITTNFTFRDSGGNHHVLTLDAMTDLKPAGGKQRKTGQCFGLTFTGTGAQALEQDTYQVEHFALGSFALFVTSGSGAGSAYTVNAVINRA